MSKENKRGKHRNGVLWLNILQIPTFSFTVLMSIYNKLMFWSLTKWPFLICFLYFVAQITDLQATVIASKKTEEEDKDVRSIVFEQNIKLPQINQTHLIKTSFPDPNEDEETSPDYVVLLPDVRELHSTGELLFISSVDAHCSTIRLNLVHLWGNIITLRRSDTVKMGNSIKTIYWHVFLLFYFVLIR